MSGFLQSQRRISITGAAALAAVALLVSGCGHHHRQTSSRAPQTAPPLAQPNPAAPAAPAPPASASNLPPGRIPPTPLPPGGVTPEDVRYVNTHPPR